MNRLTSGSQMALRINGVAQTVSGPALTPSFGAAFALGNSTLGGAPWTGLLMHQVEHDVILTDAEVAAIERFMNLWWY